MFIITIKLYVFLSHSAFKACHPQVMMFYFAAENYEEMNL